jgi:C2H2 type zinc-finger (2 copies)
VKSQVESWSILNLPFEETQNPNAKGTPRTGGSEFDPRMDASAPKRETDVSLAGSHNDARDQSHIDELPTSGADTKNKSHSKNFNEKVPTAAGPSTVALEDEKTACLTFDPLMCLFCLHRSSGLDENLIHMQTAHGLSIPDQGRLYSLESFIHYLFTIIFEFNECLYCGVIKGSAKGVQQHMLTKGHCKTSTPQKESDIRHLYDFSDSEEEGEDDLGTFDTKADNTDRENLANSNEAFVRISSGKTLGHRLTARGSRQPSHQAGSAKSSRCEAPGNNEVTTVLNTGGSGTRLRARGQLTTRTNDERALVGVPEWQRRAIRAGEKKILKVEIRARNRYEAAVQRAADERPDLRQRRVTRVPGSI